jgi:hypothetical protein
LPIDTKEQKKQRKQHEDSSSYITLNMTTGQVTWTTTRSLIASKGTMMLLLASIVIMAMSRLNAVVDAFQTTPSFHHHRHHHSEKTATFTHQHNHRQILDPKTTSAMVLCSTPSDNDEAAASSVVGTEGDSLSPSYPIDLPSPLLLASSMVLAIVGTGA